MRLTWLGLKLDPLLTFRCSTAQSQQGAALSEPHESRHDVLGPNLRKEFPHNVVPEAMDVVKVETNGDEMFFKVDPDVVYLSAFINWVFMDLDNA